MSFLCCLSVMLLITVLSTLAFPDRLDVLQHQCEPIYRKTQKDDSLTGGEELNVVSSKQRDPPECVTDTIEMLCHRFKHQKHGNSEITSVHGSDESCILLRWENMTCRPRIHQVDLPMELKPGMKMIIQGGSSRGVGSSQLSITRAPKNPTNPSKWVHTELNWKKGTVILKEGFGFGSKTFRGDFPISDRYNFTITIQITEFQTEIYAGNVLVKKTDYIPGLCEFNVQNFGRIHFLVVKKTDGECQNINDGH